MSQVLIPIALLFVGTFVPVFIGACIVAVDRNQAVRLNRVSISTFMSEWASLMLAVVLMPFGVIGWGPRRAGTDSGRVPVVFVPGFAMNRSCFTFLAIYLRRLGWSWVWGINNRPYSRPVPFFAERLRDRVERILDKSGAEQVDLVGHSMGGVVAAFYVAELGGDKRVRQLITIGTPWRGTRMWVFGRLRQARDLAAGSEVIEALTPPRVSTTAIWSRHDALIIPTSHGYAGGMKAIELADIGHMQMLASARVFRLVADLLATAPEGKPAHDEVEAHAQESA